MKMDKISIFLQKNPIAKTIIFGVSVILSGVLTGAFISEISYEDGLHWADFYKKGTFWLIVLYLILVYIYNYLIYQQDVSVERFMDREYSRAYVFKACMPEFVDKCKEEIIQGNGIEGAKRLSEFLKEI